MFNRVFYKQIQGLPNMASPLSPLLIETFMADFEKRLFNGNNKYIKFVKHSSKYYVEDIFCIWVGTDRLLNSCLNSLNLINNGIEFAIEIEKEDSINFLDFNIKRVNNKFKYQIYRQPTQTDTINY